MQQSIQFSCYRHQKKQVMYEYEASWSIIALMTGNDTIRYDMEFALENWQDRTCQFSLAHKN